MFGRFARAVHIVLLLGAIVWAAGCDPGSMLYFAGAGDDNKPPGEMKLARENGKEVKVAILVFNGVETRPEFVTADRELSRLLTRQLQKQCADNREKVSFIAASKIQEFKNNHPDWQNMKMEEIGERFQADYVIYIEIESMSLYEKGSANQLYRGRANLSVKLVSVAKPDDETFEKEYRAEYPRARGPIPVDDEDPRGFYLAFLDNLAKHVSWYFTGHPAEAESCE